MTIRIRRNTGFLGSLSAIKVKINGEKAAKINQNIELEIPGDTAAVRVSQFGQKSNEMRVKDGDSLVITTRPWVKLLFILLVLISVAISTIIESRYNITVLVIMLVIVIGVYSLFDGFRLQHEE